MSEPLASVVVSTRNRPARLQRLLDALRAQELRGGAFEVIVVDDGSDQPTGALLERESQRGGLALRSARNETPHGPAAARNLGWSLARSELVAFTDDDCVPEPGWLAAGLAAHTEHPGAVIQGITIPERSELPSDGPLTRTVRVDSLGPQYEACNIFYPRRLLYELDGFDERFGPHDAGEDTDLAWRAIERGAPTVLAADAVVHHAVEPLRIGGKLRSALRWRMIGRVLAEHPGARAMLHRRLFWNVWHYLLWRSLVALAAPPTLRRMLLARHLLELRKRARRGGGSSSLIGVLLLYDALECWSIAGGAIRYRTVVL